MRAAGITRARIKTLEAKRRAAAVAETAQGAARGQKTGEAMTKDQLVRELAKWNTRVIDIGALVFKGEPKILQQFEQYRLRRKRARTPKAPPAASPPSPAST